MRRTARAGGNGANGIGMVSKARGAGSVERAHVVESELTRRVPCKTSRLGVNVLNKMSGMNKMGHNPEEDGGICSTLRHKHRYRQGAAPG